MKVSLSIEVGYLCPLILLDVIDLTLVHGFIRQGGADREYLRLFAIHQDTGQGVRASLE